jgi:hypothetical protein
VEHLESVDQMENKEKEGSTSGSFSSTFGSHSIAPVKGQTRGEVVPFVTNNPSVNPNTSSLGGTDTLEDRIGIISNTLKIEDTTKNIQSPSQNIS